MGKMNKRYLKESELRKYIHRVIQEMKAYHGSGAHFNKFDSNFSGSGEGSAVFGPGHYFTSSKQIGKDYANEHGTSQREVAKIAYKGCGGDYYYQGHQLYKALDEILDIKDFDDANEHYLWQYIPKYMKYYKNKQDFIRKIYSYLIWAVKSKEDYKEDTDWYGYKLNKALKFLYDNLEESQRSLYQVEIPNEDKFANWLMEVPKEWYKTLQYMLYKIDNGDKYINKLKTYFNNYIDRYGKLTVETLYYSLNNMHYDATLGNNLFKWLLKHYGYVGVKYPSGMNYKTSSTKEGDMNYTVFDDDNVKITNRWDY